MIQSEVEALSVLKNRVIKPLGVVFVARVKVEVKIFLNWGSCVEDGDNWLNGEPAELGGSIDLNLGLTLNDSAANTTAKERRSRVENAFRSWNRWLDLRIDITTLRK